MAHMIPVLAHTAKSFLRMIFRLNLSAKAFTLTVFLTLCKADLASLPLEGALPYEQTDRATVLTSCAPFAARMVVLFDLSG